MAFKFDSELRGGAHRPIRDMSLGELEAIRLILRGSSVIDWRGLHFRDAAEVDHFLRLNLLDLGDPRDERRLRSVLAQAVEYLRRAFGYRVAAAVAEPVDVRDLFLLASGVSDLAAKYRRIGCVVLKCMHVVHHLEARELLFRTPIREADLAERVDRRVMAEALRMQELGLPVVQFSGNVKARDSLITKLLAKRETVAAQIFDRVRYRIVTQRQDQIPSILNHLTRHLFPFNFVVPGQSHNTLVRFRELVGRHPAADEIIPQLQAPLDLEAGDARSTNAFTAKGYKSLTFVVDLPVRVDELLQQNRPLEEDLGRIVFSLVEFQVIDAATARRNEVGAANHQRYKKRQSKAVLRRLSRGLVVPKRRRAR